MGHVTLLVPFQTACLSYNCCFFEFRPLDSSFLPACLPVCTTFPTGPLCSKPSSNTGAARAGLFLLLPAPQPPKCCGKRLRFFCVPLWWRPSSSLVHVFLSFPEFWVCKMKSMSEPSFIISLQTFFQLFCDIPLPHTKSANFKSEFFKLCLRA